MSENPIVERKYWFVKMQLASPLSVHGHENYYTDGDVIVDAKGTPFLPGSSIAGALRAYLGTEKKDDCLYGYADGEKGRMSSVFISDLFFEEKKNIVTVRDRVSLAAEKSVNNKFDLQVIDTGATGILRLEIVKRKNDKENFESVLYKALLAIENGEIRFGSVKTRGFGKIKILEVAEKTFNSDSLAEWLAFQKNPTDKLDYETFDKWSADKDATEDKYVHICVPLQLTGGISIRKYSTRPGKADFEHLTANGEPVIPGTSWNGAIRADVRRILQELGCKNTDQCIDTWFGYVRVRSGSGKNVPEKKDSADSKEQKVAQQSMVIFGESILKGAVSVPISRNKINRFTGGTVNGALYSEISFFGGVTELEILVKKDENGYYKPLIGALSLALFDLCQGFLAIGGQVAVGRGIFRLAEGDEITYGKTGEINLAACLSELANILKTGEET